MASKIFHVIPNFEADYDAETGEPTNNPAQASLELELEVAGTRAYTTQASVAREWTRDMLNHESSPVSVTQFEVVLPDGVTLQQPLATAMALLNNQYSERPVRTEYQQ